VGKKENFLLNKFRNAQHTDKQTKNVQAAGSGLAQVTADCRQGAMIESKMAHAGGLVRKAHVQLLRFSLSVAQ
jgi:hypothetical protein